MPKRIFFFLEGSQTCGKVLDVWFRFISVSLFASNLSVNKLMLPSNFELFKISVSFVVI